MFTETLSSLKKRFAPIKRPPGPSVFQASDVLYEDSEFFNLDYPVKLAKTYGDFVYSKAFKIYLGTGPSVFEHILKTNPKNYIREARVYGHMKLMFGNSLLVNEGEAWKYRRRMSLPAYQHQTLQNYIPIMTGMAENQLKLWEKQLPRTLNILSVLNQLSLNIAFKMFCSQEFPKKTLEFLGNAIGFSNLYCGTSKIIFPWKPTFSNMRFYWYVKKTNQIFLNIIERRREEKDPPTDLLQLLLNAKSEETGQLLSDQEVLAEFKTHMITGHETTACGLSWMWYLLAKNPEYRDQMEAELDEVLGGRLPTAEDLPKLVVTKAIISETFRLCPPIWSLARTNLEADVINGYEIPARSRITLHLYALHRNPHYWENPDDFRPERFLDTDAKRHPFLFLPFSAGSHTCVASHLGMLEMTLVTATLGQRIRFNMKADTIVPREPCITLKPRGGIVMWPSFRK